MKFVKIFCTALLVMFSHGTVSTAIQLEYQEFPDQKSTFEYFSVVERATPVLFRIPRNSSEVPKELSLHRSRRFLPRNLDLLLRRKKHSLRMRLHRMRDVIGSHTRVEWTDGEGMESKVLSPKCVYHGKVNGMENSLATVDLCNDMRGIIRTDFDDIYLQPLADYSFNDERFHDESDSNGTHIIRIHRRLEETVDNHRTDVSAINLTADTITSHHNNNQNGADGADDEEKMNRRHKRQTLHRGPRFMQVLLVTDGSLVRFHGRNLIEQYLLTQMSIVDNIYHHPSLGFEINIIVVKIKIIEDSLVRKLAVRGDGKESLDRFCQWASNEKPKNRNKDEDFDVAVYITKEEIGPAGFAPVTGMCNPIRSCALVKDDGTSSAFVIAHEIGHVFGMIHDGHGNRCSDDPSDGKIMASMVQSNYHTYYWSPCNKEALEKYLVDIHCLDDKPRDSLWPVYSQPFGQSWSLDEQCRQEFGSGYSLCRAFDHLDPCNHLWCSHASNTTLCKTKRGPPLPGTSCGRGKWCMNGSCLEKRSVAVDGGWSSWQNWEACSRTCGIGIQFRVRFCNQPRPKHGGRDCRGEREEFRGCNAQRCPQLTDFRAEQCTEFNEKRFDDGRRHHWQPHENKNASEMCKVTCISRETRTVMVSEANAVDGTFCSYDQPNQVCVKGKCQAVGCDGVLNSRQREDQCGYCGGNGASCKRVSGHFTDPLSKKEYHLLLVVPTGARNIMITERQSMPHLAHFIAVRDSKTEAWYLNGNTQQEPSRHFVVHGTSFIYSNKQRDGETLTARGPLLAPVEIMVYSMSSKLPPAIDYDFVIPGNTVHTPVAKKIPEQNRLNPDTTSRYVWAVSGWTNCSKPCGTGTQFEVFACVDTEKRSYSDGFCSQLTKPREGKQECNTRPCALYTYWWDADDWSSAAPCSASCGSYGVQQRRVQCLTDNKGQSKAIDPAYCNQRLMPNYIQPCNRFPCTAIPPSDATIAHPSTAVSTSSATKSTTAVTTQTTAVSPTAQGVRGSEVKVQSSTLNTPQPGQSTSQVSNNPSSSSVSTSSATKSTMVVTSQTTAVSPTAQGVRGSEVKVQSSTPNPPPTERNTSLVTENPRVNSKTESQTYFSSVASSDPEPVNPRISIRLIQERESVKFTSEDATTTTSLQRQHSSALSSQPQTSSPSVTSQDRNSLKETHLPLEKETKQVKLTSPHSRESEEFDDFVASSESEMEYDMPGIAKKKQDSDRGPVEAKLSLTTTEWREIPAFRPVDSPVTSVRRPDYDSTRVNSESSDSSNDGSVAFKHRSDTTKEILLPTETVRSGPSSGGSDHRVSNTTITTTTTTKAVATSTVSSVPQKSAYPRRLDIDASSVAKTVVRSNGPVADRPTKIKATIRKTPRKTSVHAPTAETAPVPRETRLPVTTTPGAVCLQDRSSFFCRAGANRDRCSKQTFFALCCFSCRAYVPA